MVCHLFYTERHSNRLTVINPSNFLGSLHDLSPGLFILKEQQPRHLVLIYYKICHIGLSHIDVGTESPIGLYLLSVRLPIVLTILHYNRISTVKSFNST